MNVFGCRILIAVAMSLVTGSVSGQDPAERRGAPTRKYLELEQRNLAVGDVAALQFSADGTRLAAAIDEHQVFVWSLGKDGSAAEPPLEFSCEEGQVVQALAFSPDSGMLAAASLENRIWLWDLHSAELLASLDTTGAENAHLQFLDDVLIVADVDNILRLYRAPALQPLDEWPRAFLPGLRGLSSGGEFALQVDQQTYRLTVWDLGSRSKLPLDIPTCRDDLVAVTPDGRSLYLAGKDLVPNKKEVPNDREYTEDNRAAADNWDTIEGGVWRFDTNSGDRVWVRSADDRQILQLFTSANISSQFFGLVYGDSVELNYRGSDDPIDARLKVRANGGASYGPHVAISSNWPPRVARTRDDDTIQLSWWTVQERVDDMLEMAVGSRGPTRMATASSADAEADPFVSYTVYYGTNRQLRDQSSNVWRETFARFFRRDVGIILFMVSGLAFLVAVIWMALVGALSKSRFFLLGFLSAASVVGVASAYTWLVVRNDLSKPGELYGSQRGPLRYGRCDVTIPNSHKPGELEGPILFLTADPERHIVLQEVAPVEGRLFLERLYREAKGEEAFVFIHGYNVSFEDAARRTAQMAYDLEFPGVPIFFSWPSKADIFGYVQDLNNSDLAGSQLATFLSDIEKYSGARRVHLIAHSMGTKVLSNALQNLGRDRIANSRFREIILAAPDIDAEYFRNSIAPAIAAGFPPSEDRHRVTLYASTNDKALQISKRVNGYPRAGDAQSLVVYPGIDTIDVSSLEDMSDSTGHSYYGKLPDLFALLEEHQPAESRSETLIRKYDRALPYWVHK